MTTGIAEYVHQQFRSAIRNQMMPGKIPRRIHEGQNLDDTFYTLQITTTGILQSGNHINRCVAGGDFAVFNRNILAELGNQRFAVFPGNMAGQINQIAGLDIHHISGNRFGNRRQFDIQCFALFINGHFFNPDKR